MSRRAVKPAMPASAVRALARARGPLLLAVSGGLDSMVLLHMAARRRAVRQRCCVATFDHATGPHATSAARLVRARARALRIPVITGRAVGAGRSEAEWREMRWRFLRSVAARRGATVVIAHTRDDQVETIVMRTLRGAGARGLAALYATSPTLRPLLDVSRTTLERYARAHAVEFVEDPTNADRRFLRNRVRRDLLPAIRAVRPRFEREILSLARRAGRLRRRTEQIAHGFSFETNNRLEIDVSVLARLSADSLGLLWPAFVARLGVPLDRRGVERATHFTLSARVGQTAQCAGGIKLERTRGSIVVSRRSAARMPATVELGQTVEFGEWRLRQVTRAAFAARPATQALWGAAIARSEHCSVRSWQQGDRIRAAGQSLARRVKRYFRELAIPASDRGRWPVVVGGNEVLWVPGVCVSGAAVERLGAETTYFVCERHAG